MIGYLTGRQVDTLLMPIHPRRVSQRDGMAYVEGYDIRAELNRVFGFCRWCTEILGQSLICETQVKTSKGKDAWYVAYRTSLRLSLYAPDDGSLLAGYEESHVGDSTHPVRGEAHGNALTNSHTYALKRCATNLGDQFGLSLYGKGSTEKLVRWTLLNPGSTSQASVKTDDVPQVVPEHDTAPADPPAPGDATTSDGRAVQATPPPRQTAAGDGSIDTVAQQFADKAATCSTTDELLAVQTAASTAKKLLERVADPGTGVVGSLAGYINFKRRSLREAS